MALRDFISKALIRKHFYYKKGHLYWKQPLAYCVKKGGKYGYVNSTRYITGHFFSIKMLEHRLIWIYHYGKIKNNLMIDHKNGDTQDNRIKNLRLVDNRLNQLNQKRHRNGFLPKTTYNKRDKRFYVYVSKNKKKIYIGSYSTGKDANRAYIDYLKKNKLIVQKGFKQ